MKGDTDSLKGDTDSVKGETDSVKGDTDSVKGDTDILNEDTQTFVIAVHDWSSSLRQNVFSVRYNLRPKKRFAIEHKHECKISKSR